MPDFEGRVRELGLEVPDYSVTPYYALAFELCAFIDMANFHFVLFREPEVLERGRRAVRGALSRAVAHA